MSRRKHIVAILLFLLSWGYLIYKLCVFDDYQALYMSLSALPKSNYWFLVVLVLLMPLNLYLEISKWHLSVNSIHSQPFKDSFRQVILGNSGAFITPLRLGEHPSRAYYIDDKDVFLAAVVLGFVGTFALEIINVGLGLPASFFYFADSDRRLMLGVYVLIFLLIVGSFLSLPLLGKWMSKRKPSNRQTAAVVDSVSGLRPDFLLKLLSLSLLRYAVYCVQLFLALRFFDISLTPLQALVAIPTYYMLVSVTPSLPIADAAVRGSWSIVVFQAYTLSTPSIAFAAMLLWLVNTALPLVALPFLKTKTQQVSGSKSSEK